MMPLTGLIGWFDPRKLLTIGHYLDRRSLAVASQPAGRLQDIFWPQLIRGRDGLLFCRSPRSRGSVPRERMGNATSLFNPDAQYRRQLASPSPAHCSRDISRR
jgi:hypothetical protein